MPVSVRPLENLCPFKCARTALESIDLVFGYAGIRTCKQIRRTLATKMSIRMQHAIDKCNSFASGSQGIDGKVLYVVECFT